MIEKRVLGRMCRNFRLDVLNKTLREVQTSEQGIKALSAFEHGKSSNYEHIFKYINACDNEKQVTIFMDKIKFIANAYY